MGGLRITLPYSIDSRLLDSELLASISFLASIPLTYPLPPRLNPSHFYPTQSVIELPPTRPLNH